MTSLRRHVRTNPPEEVRRPQVAVQRDPAAPDQKTRTDHRPLGPRTDPATGKNTGCRRS
ncbi:hypothetical protein KPATCC21470_0049 [Kitasatospora purpeofusca]